MGTSVVGKTWVENCHTQAARISRGHLAVVGPAKQDGTGPVRKGCEGRGLSAYSPDWQRPLTRIRTLHQTWRSRQWPIKADARRTNTNGPIEIVASMVFL